MHMTSSHIFSQSCPIIQGNTRNIELVTAPTAPSLNLNNWRHNELIAGNQIGSASMPLTGSVRFRCTDCSNCHTVRLNLQDTAPSSRLQKRIEIDSREISMRLNDAPDYTEHAEVFGIHAQNRVPHWINETVEQYTEQQRVRRQLQNTSALEFRRRADNALVGAVLYDVLPETAHRPRSAYGQCNYYMPDDPTRESPGIIQFARAAAWLSNQGFAYLYLGIWTESASIYHYKSRFKPEVFDNGEWVKWDDFQKRQALRIALVP